MDMRDVQCMDSSLQSVEIRVGREGAGELYVEADVGLGARTREPPRVLVKADRRAAHIGLEVGSMSSHNNLKIFSGELLPLESARPSARLPLTPLPVQGRRILNSPN